MSLYDNVLHVTDRFLLQPAGPTASDTAKSKSTSTSEGTCIIYHG